MFFNVDKSVNKKCGCKRKEQETEKLIGSDSRASNVHRVHSESFNEHSSKTVPSKIIECYLTVKLLLFIENINEIGGKK